MSEEEGHVGKAAKALLVLEDGTFFYGTSLGAQGETFGEMVFNTGMTGYQEVLTDPSYKGQIVVMTYPEIGIYGVNEEDVESRTIQVAGFVVFRGIRKPFNVRATMSFTEYLEKFGVVAIEGVDTRALTRIIRTRGAMRGAISTEDLDPESLLDRVRRSPKMEGRNLAQEASPTKIVYDDPGRKSGPLIAVVDSGVKEGIIRDLHLHGARTVRLPYDVSVDDVVKLKPDGVLISNGPGDPAVLSRTIELIRGILKYRIPLAGICLGHQLLALAVGGRTYKMRFGHRGINHPVKDLRSGRVLITTHNHGFAVDPTTFGIPKIGGEDQDAHMLTEDMKNMPLLEGRSPNGFGRIEVTHISLNDGTIEGIRLLDYPAFSVQFHPEASPGPHDAKGFFREFLDMVEVKYAQKN